LTAETSPKVSAASWRSAPCGEATLRIGGPALRNRVPV